MAAQGITLPLPPLPGARVSLDLGVLSYQYVRLGDEPNPVYATLEDAHAGLNPVRSYEAGKLKYVTYIEPEPTEEGRKPKFYKLTSGGWVGGGSRYTPYNRFSGLAFSSTPANSFGWVLPLKDKVQSKHTPGYENNDFTDRKFQPYEILQIYSVKLVGKTNWYLIGPDEWIEETNLGRVIINTKAPEGVTNGRWIEVNLFEQTLSVYDQNQLVFATLIASGQDGAWTRPGLFHIQNRLESTKMTAAFAADRSDFYYLDDVPYTMYYDDARALHGAYWRAYMGYTQSHGCVNLAVADAHWLYDWAQVGDAVYVWDPSGKTPTDPAAYSGGGAP